MKKILLIPLALLLALVILLVSLWRDEPLTPLAEWALHYQPAPVLADRNIFAGLLGFDAPAGSDFISAGAEVIRRLSLRQEPEANPSALDVRDFDAFCPGRIILNCLNDPDEIRANAKGIQKALRENRELTQRYLKIQDMPTFSNGISAALFGASSGYRYHGFLSVSRLLIAQAVLDIENGNVAQGLGWIQKDMALYRRILAATDANMLDKMIALAQIQQDARLLGLLMEKGKLRAHDETLRALLVPLASPKKIFRDAMWVEHVAMSRHVSRMMATPGLEKIAGLDGYPVEQGYLARLFDTPRYYFLYKPNMTANLRAELWRHELEMIDALPPARLREGIEDIERQRLARAGCVFEARLFCKRVKNRVGALLTLTMLPNNAAYLLRIYDVDARLRLMRARLEYGRAARGPGDDPVAILAALPPETFNPYTDLPFDWDAQRGVLGFQPASGEYEKERVEIRLPGH
jgi:hypothetical protein